MEAEVGSAQDAGSGRGLSGADRDATALGRASPLVLHVRVVSETGGGPEKTILDSPRYLRQFGYRSKCAYMHPPGDGSLERLAARARLAEAPLVSLPDRGPWDWRVVAALVRRCRDEDVRIWHGHDYKSNALGLWVRLFHPLRLVTTVHGWVQRTWRTPLYYRIDRWSLRHYDAVVCVSEDLYAQCRAGGVPGSRCHLIPNGVDAAAFRRIRDRETARAAWNGSPTEFLLGAAGRLSAEKGFDVLIRAVAELVRREVPVSLWIAGEGKARPALERLIRQLELGQRVRLLGHLSDLKPFYQALDVFVLSSMREGMPNVVLEAMALEVPVVATRVAGVPSLISHGENGLLVDIGSVDQLTSALQRAFTEPESRAVWGRAGRRTVETSYSFAGRMRRMVAVYQQLGVTGNGTGE